MEGIDLRSATVEVLDEFDRVAAVTGKEGYFAMKRLGLRVNRWRPEYGDDDPIILTVYMMTPVGKAKSNIWSAYEEQGNIPIVTNAPLVEATAAAASYLMSKVVEEALGGES